MRNYGWKPIPNIFRTKGVPNSHQNGIFCECVEIIDNVPPSSIVVFRIEITKQENGTQYGVVDIFFTPIYKKNYENITKKTMRNYKNLL